MVSIESSFLMRIFSIPELTDKAVLTAQYSGKTIGTSFFKVTGDLHVKISGETPGIPYQREMQRFIGAIRFAYTAKNAGILTGVDNHLDLLIIGSGHANQ